MKKLLTAAALCGLTATAFADDTRGYIGAELGRVDAEIKVPGYNGDFTFEPTSLKVKGGARFSPNLAVEGYMGFGLTDDDIKNTYGGEAELNTLIGVDVKGILPLGDVAEVYAKLGLAHVEFEDSDSDRYKELGLAYGIGAAFSLSPSAAITLDYSVLPDAENSEWDLDVESSIISIGFQYYPE